MLDGTGRRRLNRIALLLLLCNFLAAAQNVALFTSVKGVVSVKKASGATARVSSKEPLGSGDEITTSGNGFAVLMYFTGKEVTLSPNKTYTVSKDIKEDSFLDRLATVFSHLLWTKDQSKSVLGASRAFEPAVNRTVSGVYPSFAVERGPVLVFEWNDNQPNPGGTYVVTLRSEKGTIEKSITVSDARRVLLPIARMNLQPGAAYRWQVRDQRSGVASKEIQFSLLSDRDKEELDRRRGRLKEVCKDDSTGFRFTLLEAVLCLDSNLMMQAEYSLSNLVKLKPDFVVGHEMLIDVYRKVGKLEEANAEQKVLKSLVVTN